MKKPVYLLLLPTLLFALYGCDQPQSSGQATTATAAPAPEGPVVATVNGAPIMKSVLDVYGAQRKAKQGEGEQIDDQEILNEVISLELMRQEGVSKGLDTSPTVVATLDQQTRTLLAGAAIRDFVQNNPVTDEQAKAVYDKEIGKPGTEYKARHILVKTQEEAEKIISELDKGGDFSALAKEKSTDTSASEGGELGWFSTAQMVQPFSDTLVGLKKGSYTEEPVQTQFGWHVILLEDTRESTPPAFDDEYKARHILVKTKEEAKEIISQLNKGGDFIALAKEKSTDTSASEGGELGWLSTTQMEEQMGEPFADAVAGLNKGSYTEEPVQTQFGWNVILLEGTRGGIKDRLKMLIANQQLQQHIQQVREAAKIEIIGK